jgi:2'-5' RNA ligase
MATTLRVFLALTPPSGWQEQCDAAQCRLKAILQAQSGREQRSIKWVAPENIHLTLLFLGEVAACHIPEIAAAVERAAQSTPSFVLDAGELGSFPSRGAPRVLWLGVRESGALQSLRARLTSELKARRGVLCPAAAPDFEAGRFAPHLTLARIKHSDAGLTRVLRAQLADFALPPFAPWPVDELQLLRSQLTPQGAEYSCLAAARL